MNGVYDGTFQNTTSLSGTAQYHVLCNVLNQLN